VFNKFTPTKESESVASTLKPLEQPNQSVKKLIQQFEKQVNTNRLSVTKASLKNPLIEANSINKRKKNSKLSVTKTKLGKKLELYFTNPTDSPDNLTVDLTQKRKLNRFVKSRQQQQKKNSSSNLTVKTNSKKRELERCGSTSTISTTSSILSALDSTSFLINANMDENDSSLFNTTEIFQKNLLFCEKPDLDC
jgi:hypothetical protein